MTIGRRIARGVAALSLGAAVVLSMLPFAVRAFYPPEKLKALIEEKAGEATGRRLRIARLSWALSGFRIEDARIAEEEGAGDVIRIRSLRLGVNWLLSAFRRRWVLSRIDIHGLTVIIRRSPEGRFNLPRLPRGGAFQPPIMSTAPAPAIEPEAFACDVNLRRLSVTDAAIEYQDAASGDSWSLSGIRLGANHVTIQEPFTTGLELAATHRKPGTSARHWHIVFNGAVNPAGGSPEGVELMAQSLNVESGPWRLVATGSLHDIKTPRAALHCRLSSGAWSLADGDIVAALKSLSPLSGKASVHLTLRSCPDASCALWTELAPSLAVTGRLSLDRLGRLRIGFLRAGSDRGEWSARGWLDDVLGDRVMRLSIQGDWRLPPIAWMPEADLALSAALGPQGLGIRQLKVAAGKGSRIVTSEGLWRGFPGRHTYLNIPLTAEPLNVEDLSKLWPWVAAYSLRGTGRMSLRLRGPPRRLSYSGTFAAKRLSAKLDGYIASRIKGRVRFNANRVAIEALSGYLAGQRIMISRAIIDDDAAVPKVDINAVIPSLDIGALMAARSRRPSVGRRVRVLSQAHARWAAAHPGKPWESRGTLKVGRLVGKDFYFSKAALAWEAAGKGSEPETWDGRASLSVKSGRIEVLGGSEGIRLLDIIFLPFTIVQKITSLGGLKIFPNLSHVSFNDLSGRYLFKSGVLKIERIRMGTGWGTISIRGRMIIPSRKLDMEVTALLAHVAPIVVHVGGTVEHPSFRLAARTIIAPVENLFQGLFGH